MAEFASMHAHHECPYRHLHTDGMRAALAALEGVGVFPNHYVKGSLVTVTDTLTDFATGAPVTAPSATGYSMSPNGTKTTYTPSAVGANQWRFQINANAPGQWGYRTESPPGTGQGAAEGIFFVDPSPF